ncbi:hypothetical protein KAR52_01785 [Candidatus Pacearchaeota archaeon]|nr:hypothetical protein [Candidatus Pacearchaeota archaeon]
MSKFKKLNIKKFGDIQLTKLSIIAFVLLVLNLWEDAMSWVGQVHWGWFLGAMILFALRPIKKLLRK